MSSEKTTQGSNIFILDGPIGRLRYFLVTVVIFCYSFFVSLLMASYAANGIKMNIYLFGAISLILNLLIPFYLTTINLIKRFHDLLGDKRKAIYYYILYLVAIAALAMLGVFVTRFFEFGLYGFYFVVMLLGIFVKGKLVSSKVPNTDENSNTEENVG